MTEIRGAAPLSSSAPAVAPSAAGGLALKLLEPLQGLLSPGQSSTGEVVEVRTNGAEQQVVLRLSLPSGQQASIHVRSSAPVNLGTALLVTALADDRLLAQPAPGGRAALERLDLALLPPGTQIQTRVTGSQSPGAAGESFRLLLTVLDGPAANSRLLVDSPRGLPIGSLLTTTVQGEQQLAFVPLSSRLDQLALHQQLGEQFTRQGSVAALFGALAHAADSPPGVRQAKEQLLALLPELEQLGEPTRLAQALGKSGLFLEAALLAQGGDALADDLKAGLLRLVAQLLPNLPGSSPLASVQGGHGLGQALPAFARQMLDALGQGPRQQGLDFPLPSRVLAGLDGEADLETLLKLAAAAIARLQTHQLSSLAQTQTTADGLQLTTWQMEIPMRNGADVLPLQAWLQREEEPARPGEERRETLWRLELAFDLPPLGPLQVQAQLIGTCLSSQLWAEQPATARLIDEELPRLRARLEEAGLAVGELQCHQGLPAQGPRTRLEQRFVDETA